VREHAGLHAGAVDTGRAHLDVVAVGNQQYLAEIDLLALGRFKALDTELVALRHPVLLAARLNDRVHRGYS